MFCYVAYGTTIRSNISGWVSNTHDHDESDTLIVCIVRKVLELQSEQLKVRIISPAYWCANAGTTFCSKQGKLEYCVWITEQ